MRLQRLHPFHLPTATTAAGIEVARVWTHREGGAGRAAEPWARRPRSADRSRPDRLQHLRPERRLRYVGHGSELGDELFAQVLVIGRKEQHGRRAVVPAWNLPFWGRVFAVFFQQVATTHFEAGMRGRAFGYLAASVASWPFFLRPDSIYEPPVFRLRTLARFFREGFKSRPS